MEGKYHNIVFEVMQKMSNKEFGVWLKDATLPELYATQDYLIDNELFKKAAIVKKITDKKKRDKTVLTICGILRAKVYVDDETDIEYKANQIIDKYKL